jgi:AcrR family transcriptional regulator
MEEKNQKRRDILKSAMVLFRDKGFHNTKMEDIAAGAGVGKGTLYEYFESKQDIFDETCIEYVNEIVNKIKCISDLKDTFHNKLLILFNENLKMESDITLDDVLSSKNIIHHTTPFIILLPEP